MNITATALGDARKKFVAALELAKERIALTPGPEGRRREGSNRTLAQDIGVSPSRIGEFLNSAWSLPVVSADNTYFPDAKVRRVVTGFATSVERALEWLKKEGFAVDGAGDPDERALTRSIVEGYWPNASVPKDVQRVFREALSEGIRSVSPEIKSWSRFSVRVKMLPWGPFAEKGSVPEGFLRHFGEVVLRSIDPVDCHAEFAVASSLADVLDLPATSRREGLILALGVYDTPYRQFRGFHFVTFPVRVPLIGLLVTRESVEPTSCGFEKVFGTTSDRPTFAINREVGHLFIGSIYPDVLNLKLFGETEPAVEIAEKLRKAARANTEAAFISDGILAIEIFSILSRQKGISVRPIAQDKDHEAELSFRIGFMLRSEDRDISDLLEASQRALFRTSWRALGVFKRFIDGVERWFSEIEFHDYGWNHKLFILDEADLRGVGLSRIEAEKFMDRAEDCVSPDQKAFWSFIRPRRS